MAKPNYQYEKRQKELARKKKNEEKQQRKQRKDVPSAPGADNVTGAATDDVNTPTK